MLGRNRPRLLSSTDPNCSVSPTPGSNTITDAYQNRICSSNGMFLNTSTYADAAPRTRPGDATRPNATQSPASVLKMPASATTSSVLSVATTTASRSVSYTHLTLPTSDL